MKEGYPRGGRKKKINTRKHGFNIAKGMKTNTIHVKHRKRSRAYRLDDNARLERIGLMCYEYYKKGSGLKSWNL